MRRTSLVVLEWHLSPARLAPYRAATRTDEAAVRLYAWNARVSAAMWETIGHVEVVVRNAMDRELTAWSTRTYQQPLWYLDPGQVLSLRHQDDIHLARRRAALNGRAETQGGVIAELNFGFWRYLTASRYDRTLWMPSLRWAFPGHPAKAVHAALGDLHMLRNRIAHHEPIHNRPLARLYVEALDLAGWIAPGARKLVSDESRVPYFLSTHP